MKTIIIYLNSLEGAGGIERVISNLVEYWVRKYHVIIITKDNPANSFYEIHKDADLKSLNIPIYLNMDNRLQRAMNVSKSLILSVKKLRQYLSSIQFDYIYTTTPMNSLEVHLANPKNDKRMIISEHASAYAVNRIYLKIKKWLYPKALCISVPNRTDYEEYTVWNCKAAYIPHLASFTEKEKNNCTSKIALNIGRLTADKRQDELLSIWSKVQKCGWKLWIVGKGEEEQRLKALIQEYSLSDSVKLIDPTCDIGDIYKQVSLFLFTSKAEGFGMVLLEAMAFGIPCISYDCPSGPRDIIKNGYNGFLIKNNDKEEFIATVNSLIRQGDMEKLSIGAYNTVKKWDNEAILQKWDRVFK